MLSKPFKTNNSLRYIKNDKSKGPDFMNLIAGIVQKLKYARQRVHVNRELLNIQNVFYIFNLIHIMRYNF